MRRVGLIGLGLLGSALADRLLGAGMHVVGYDLSVEKRERLTSAGGSAADSAAAVFESCDAIVLCLPDSTVVMSIIDEVTPLLRAGLLIVDTSTGEVSYARTIEGHTSGHETKVDLTQRNAGLEMIQNEADAQAVRGAVLEIIDYLECVMVRRDACIAAFEAKETERRDTTRKTFRPDGPQH